MLPQAICIDLQHKLAAGIEWRPWEVAHSVGELEPKA